MRQGVTLVELIVVVALIGLMAAISFPAIGAGLDAIRLRSAADNVASFLQGATNRAERRREVIEVSVEPKSNRIELRSTEPGFARALAMPENVAISGEEESRILLIPGGAFPRVIVDLANVRGARKRVTLDPISGVPVITVPE